MKRIAILLTVFNRKKQTLKCLTMLSRQNLPQDVAYSVFLTDDGCTDGTPEAVAEQFPQVTIIHGDGQLFWNRGMHAAWVEASHHDYDFYLWLNDDTFITDDCIRRLLHESSQFHDQAIIVGSTCALNDPTTITYGGWVDCRPFYTGRLITDVSKPQSCEAINGNIVLISRYVYERLGTNDPYFRHSLGDSDYGLRAKKSGIGCYTATGIFGRCDLHVRPTLWMDPDVPIARRWKQLISPLGNNPFEFFHFKRRHFGLAIAICVFVSNWLHFLLPSLWNSRHERLKE